MKIITERNWTEIDDLHAKRKHQFAWKSEFYKIACGWKRI